MAIRSKKYVKAPLVDKGLGTLQDPMAGMGNLMDAMLVFACGLIIALIARYSVDLGATPEVGAVEKLDAEIEAAEQGISNSDSQYSEVGTVYRDVETGELYVLTPEESGGTEGTGDGGGE